MSDSVPNVDVNVLTGGDQPLAPAPVSRLGRWISRIVRGSLVVVVLGSAVAYGALQAKPELANYVWFIEDDAPACGKAYREMAEVETTDAVATETVTAEGDAAVAVDAEPVTVEVAPETPAE